MSHSARARALYRHLGRQVHTERKNLGITQEDLAHRVGVSRTSITNLELGKQQVPLHLLYEIAEELGTQIDALLPRHDELKSAEYVASPERGQFSQQELPPQAARVRDELLKKFSYP